MTLKTVACTWIAVAIVAAASVVGAQQTPDIRAKQAPAQLDVLQGTAIELDGSPQRGEPVPSAYHWKIVSGEGAGLYDADQATAIFQAPVINREVEVFVVQLEVDYPDAAPSSAKVVIRVHRQVPAPAKREPSIEDVMTDYYRAEQEARERNKRSSSSSSSVVVHHGYGGFYGGGWGWGWGWGGPSYSVIHAPIVVPPPGNDWDVAVPLPDVEW